MPFTGIALDTTKGVFFPVCLEDFGVQNCLLRPEEGDVWGRVVGPVRLADLGAGLMASAILNCWAAAHTRGFPDLTFHAQARLLGSSVDCSQAGLKEQ